MKAIIWTKYGSPDVLELREIIKPIPKDNEILIKIHATTVTAGDCEMRSLKFPFLLGFAIRLWIGFFKPRGNTIGGSEIAGVVEAIGKNVTLFKSGDEVYGSTGMKVGSNAEYICLRENPGEIEGGVALKPADMSFNEAATVPFGGRDALHFLRKGKLANGQKILINGAGGSIGTFAIMLAKYWGAEVTSVDSSEKLDMLRSIGSDHVIDFSREDFTENKETYDIIFDVVGTISLFRSKKSLRNHGFFLLANPHKQIFSGLWTKLTSDKNVILEAAGGTLEDLAFLRKLIDRGKIKPVIDRIYSLEEICEAHRYVETGKKQGNVVISIES